MDYRKLIEAAILAPTPDNNQPWRFAVRDERLFLYLDQTRTLPSDVNAMFDLVGLGAAIENACIAARQDGYEPHVEVVDCPAERGLVHFSAEPSFSAVAPRPENMDLSPSSPPNPSRPVASITFVPGGQPDPLYPYLATRCTCRRLYSKKPVPVESLAQMAAAAQQAGAVRVDWVTDRAQIREMARLLAAADLIRFQYEPFHNELFRQLRFTAEEADETRDGLDVRTLELPPGIGWLLRKLKPWKRMHKVHQLGLGRLLTMPSALAVKRSGAVGLLSVSHPKVALFLQGGMALERLWLTATALDLALQPLGSLPIFLAHWQQLGGSRLAATQVIRVQHLADRLRGLLPQVSEGVLQIMFRIGQSPPASFRSLRRRVEEVCASYTARG
jgi:nitroreductase